MSCHNLLPSGSIVKLKYPIPSMESTRFYAIATISFTKMESNGFNKRFLNNIIHSSSKEELRFTC